MADPIIGNPNVANRHDTRFWVAPIGVGAVIPNPVDLSDLPTADPTVAGQLWNNAGVVTESAG